LVSLAGLAGDEDDRELSYGDKVYWDQRYAKEITPGSTAPPHFDWYMSYDNSPLRDILREYVPFDATILQVGVGNSNMQHEMVDDGYRQILNTDTSAVVVEYMRALHEAIPQLSYHLADCRRMPQFDSQFVGAVLDKGTLDAIMCGDAAESDALAMVYECHRVLEPGGVMLEISYGRPSRRLPYLQLPPPFEWASITVFGVLHPKAEAEAAAAAARPPLPAVLGPYDQADAAVLDGTEVNNYYYAFVCRKPQ
jgi:SAM-dependent methyltransferase